MNEHSDKLLPHIEVDPALHEHATILANLLELYAYDFSELHSFDLRWQIRLQVSSVVSERTNRHPLLSGSMANEKGSLW